MILSLGCVGLKELSVSDELADGRGALFAFGALLKDHLMRCLGGLTILAEAGFEFFLSEYHDGRV